MHRPMLRALKMRGSDEKSDEVSPD